MRITTDLHVNSLRIILLQLLILVSLWNVDPVLGVNSATKFVKDMSSSSMAESTDCVRAPAATTASKTPGDNGFRIKIVGRPEAYTAGQVYTGKTLP